MKLSWESEAEPEGIRFAIVRRGAFGKSTRLAVSGWPNIRDEPYSQGIRRLLSWCDDEKAVAEMEFVIVPHALVASLSETQARRLGLPSPPAYSLELRSRGTIDQWDFGVECDWLERANFPVGGVTRNGAFLRVGQECFRIPQPLFDLVEAVDRFQRENTRDRDRRLALWESIQSALHNASGGQVSAEHYLASLQFFHAGAFSLRTERTARGLCLEPVLFHRSHRIDFEPVERDDEEPEPPRGEAPDEEYDALLPSEFAETFLKDRFDRDERCREAYPVGRNVFVVLDEDLRLALDVVKTIQRSDESTKTAFVKNPRAFIADALSDEVSEDKAAGLFVETRQYSERVGEMMLWERPVIPWLEREPNTWLPERFGIRIGDNTLELTNDELNSLREAFDNAKSRHASSFEFKNVTIPVDQSTEFAISQLEVVIKAPDTVEAPQEDKAQEEECAEQEEKRTYALTIIDNLEALGLAAQRKRRHAHLPVEIPIGRLGECELLPHQSAAFRWLADAWIEGRPGVLLADDMGLGKTFTTLAFLAWLQDSHVATGNAKIRKSTAGPILIVAPTSLLHNWIDEERRHLSGIGLGDRLDVFDKSLKAIKPAGAGTDISIGASQLKIDRLRQADWVLTTYETLANYHPSFAQIPFAVAVFDEMQKVKSPDTINTHAAKTVNANFVIGLTGTPIENRLADLWCIVDRLEPGLLSDLRTFSQNYNERNLESLGQLRIKLADSGKTPPLMLRRMKTEIQIGEGLPEKRSEVRRVSMPPEQAEVYREVVVAARGTGAVARKGDMLRTLHQLRGRSLHPFAPASVLHQVEKYDGYVLQSARLRETINILEEIDRRGEKALIFLESLEMQALLADLLHHRFGLSRRPFVINGSVPAADRKRRVDQFQSGERGFDVLILSPRAAGIGLTITAANHVIHLSRWWNPAVEDQCNDRTYRIGQSKPVTVYCPIAVHPEFGDASFDVALHNLLERKRSLSRDMLMPPETTSDVDDLYRGTVGVGERNSDGPAAEDLDAMDPVTFEHWARSRLKARGYQSFATPKSHDKGADGILRHPSTGKTVILQCKKLAADAVCGPAAVDEVINARDAYHLPESRLVVLTTAAQFSKEMKARAKAVNVLLIGRADLSLWGSYDP